MCRKFLFFIFFYVFFFISAQGQNQHKIDSLLQALTIAKDDTSKAKIYDGLTTLFMLTGDYGSAIRYANEAINSADESIPKISDTLQLRMLNKSRINSLNDIGVSYREQGNYAEALKNHFIALKLSKDLGLKNAGVSSSYNNIATVYNRQGNYPEALKNYFASLKINEEIGEKKGVASCYNNIGIIYSKEGNFAEALNNFSSALVIKEEIGDKRGIANIYQNIAETYNLLDNYSEAISNFQASLKIRKEIGDKLGLGRSYEGIGSALYNEGKYQESLENHYAALKIRKEIGDKLGIVLTLASIGNNYRELGQYTESIDCSNKGLTIAQEIGSKEALEDIYESFFRTYEKMNDYKNAFLYHKLYTEIKDSLFNETKGKQIAEMKTKYETEKKDIEIQKLESDNEINALLLKNQQESLMKGKLENLSNQQELELLAGEKNLKELRIEKDSANSLAQKAEINNKQNQVELLNKEKGIQNAEIKKQTLIKNFLIGGLALVLILFYFIYTNYRTMQKLKLENIRNNIAADLHDDIGSTLNSISLFSEVAKQEAGKPIPALDQIGVSARKIIDAMSDIVWTINPENDTFENIISRMRSLAYLMLKAKNIEFTFKADESLNQLSLPMLTRKNIYMLFIEAINNLVKYSNATRALFHISLENKNVKMLIRDNGNGFDASSVQVGNGIKNMKRRAAEIGGQLLIESSRGKGTNIKLTLKA